ncbi:hypothetical protein [Chitinophaga sp. HK235]|uniref:hypothetical protein n=1 Tax=Chitinophaga sp. HK235 TaxID=2952571 RepID=UPI001BAC73E2|nr:hypothetical protein [Chitinophaga sp. HK235]
MKNALYLLFLCLAVHCSTAPAIKQQPLPPDSLAAIPVNDADQLVYSRNGVVLTAMMAGEDRIQLEYKTRRDTASQRFSFPYLLYTGKAFPPQGIAILNDNAYSTASCYMIGDSILLLPLINHIPNGLSLYVINLHTRQILADDYRTGLPQVWINAQNNTFMIADSRQLYNDSSYVYPLYACAVKGNVVEKNYSSNISFPLAADAEVAKTTKVARKVLQ